ncbi:MAG: hypothetical protein GX793_08190 [Bacteroidales bacterium]|jgi:uncharacterized membrane protein|nr:hypothetical protein [Bacteroidales bacterium]MCK9498092.1 hypothetical protein [Bacteroidales bacterium]MDY0313582.1 hypothetical protein [Bacteroidales bacterium]NLB86964.1 hypothetical protein [Bacteroidales bacterium]NLB87023.1 hypothetical protein [Bacteroidales bacterium]
MQYKQVFEKLINEGYEVKTKQYVQEGFELFKKYSSGFISLYLIIFGIAIIASSPELRNVGNILSLLQAPLIAGFLLVANDVIKGDNPKFVDFFNGFKFFFPLLLLNIISGIFILLGMVLLIIPGLYLAVSYSFANMFIIFFNYDFWTAMELSRKIITKNWWAIFGFFIVILLINLAGILACGIGVLFTLPATTCMMYIAFEDIVGGAIRNQE